MRCLLSCLLALLLGCQKETPSAPSAVPLPAKMEPWQQESARRSQLITVGMTKDQVVRILGEPKEARGSFGARNRAYWLYPLTSNLYYRVDFDERERVENRRAWSSLPGPQ